MDTSTWILYVIGLAALWLYSEIVLRR